MVDGRSRAAGAVVTPTAEEIRAAHPHLVVTVVTPFGLHGPHAGHKATNIVTFANGGIMAITGERDRSPLQTGGDQALMLGGLHAFAATSTALLGALVQGEGDLIDISLQECAASMLEYCAAAWEYDGLLVERSGNTPRAEWGVYQAADGWAGVCCLGRQIPALLDQLGLEHEERWLDPAQRMELPRRADGPRARVHAGAHEGRARRVRSAEQAADRRRAHAGRARRPRAAPRARVLRRRTGRSAAGAAVPGLDWISLPPLQTATVDDVLAGWTPVASGVPS